MTIPPLPPDLMIADDFALPPDAVTQTFAVFGVRGSGKTYAFLTAAEAMLRAGRHVVILDPMGVCWGLRLAADGRGPGLPVTVFGGAHGDAPLPPSAGAAVADLVMGERLSVVLDLSLMDEDEGARFTAGFLRRLLFANRRPLHVFIDEAHLAAPQTPEKGSDSYVCRAATRKLVREGRVRGLGCTLADQRPQDVDKGAVSQCETLFALRLPHHLELKVVSDWVANHGTPDQARELIASLPDLPTGDAWVVSRVNGLYRRLRFSGRQTFDSSATPTEDAPDVNPAPLPPPDLDRLRTLLAGLIEEADASDVDALRRRISAQAEEIAALKAQIAGLKGVMVAVASPPPAPASQAAPTPKAPAPRTVSGAPARVAKAEAKAKAKTKKPQARAKRAEAKTKAPATRARATSQTPARKPPARLAGPMPVPAPRGLAGELRGALAVTFPRALTVAQLRLLARTDATDTEIANALRALRRDGAAEEVGGRFRATRPVTPQARPQTDEQWRVMWRRELGVMTARLLDTLAAARPERLTTAELARRAAYANSGKISRARDQLLDAGLAVRVGDKLALSDDWPPEAADPPALKLHSVP